MADAAEERAAIVRYLRDTAVLLDKLKDVRGEKVRSRHHAESCRTAADHIEWGAHWQARVDEGVPSWPVAFIRKDDEGSHD